MSPTWPDVRRLALLVGLAGLLTACGVRGSLERPDPLWGSPSDATAADAPADAATPDPEGPVTPRPN